MNLLRISLSVALLPSVCLQAQKLPESQGMAQSAMHMWKDSFGIPPGSTPKWSYDMGVILKGIEYVWYSTGNPMYFDYIQKSIDNYVTEKGEIKKYAADEYNIDHINNGKSILTLYKVTGKEKYRKAADLLRQQLRTHPRTKEGGFWHKKIYPHQMWLDGLYMAQPFYAEYAALFGEDTAFADIARQFTLMERYARDARTGLLYHGWDEAREQIWANKTTGLSPHVWARAMGWFGMAMVDALPFFPEQHPGRQQILAILNRFAAAITTVQHPDSGVWYDIIDMPNEPKNYFESSASCMLVYTLAKGVKLGYLPEKYLTNANKGYAGILKEFTDYDANGRLQLHKTVSVSGLGGKTNRDGSFAYYMSEPVITNDPKGIGAFIKCAAEMEMVPLRPQGAGKRVLLDNYYNNETKKLPNGHTISWHYVWDELAHGGYAVMGYTYQRHGATLHTLKAAPSAKTLRNASIYIIVDPDNAKETAAPNYPTPSEIKAIERWVKKGGVLVLLTNDAGNAALKEINPLSERFGIEFNEDNYNLVKNDNFPEGEVVVEKGNPIFPQGRKLFIKELSTLNVSPPAMGVVFKEGKTIMATASVGKGTVFALGDPWIYNEYADGRKLPAAYQNFEAMTDWIQWLLSKAASKK